jgi:hypothetical protein
MRPAALLAVLSLCACGTIDRAVPHGTTVSPRLADDCRTHCASLGMRLAAVVVSGGSGACVCEPEAAPAAPPRASLGGVAGALLIAAGVAEAAEQRQLTEHPAPMPAPDAGR